MSVYSYIEVIKSPHDSQDDKDLILEFGHGIHWSYQIAVAGGTRIYQGVQHGTYPTEPQFEELSASSIYEQRTEQALFNYHTAIGACLAAIRLRIPETANELCNDLGYLYEAQNWYQKAWHKLPDGLVRLDWSEGVWGMEEEALAKWDTPNHSYQFFLELADDCQKVVDNKLTTTEFTAKYSGERGGGEIELEIKE